MVLSYHREEVLSSLNFTCDQRLDGLVVVRAADDHRGGTQNEIIFE